MIGRNSIWFSDRIIQEDMMDNTLMTIAGIMFITGVAFLLTPFVIDLYEMWRGEK